jgi:uncharacterized protein
MTGRVPSRFYARTVIAAILLAIPEGVCAEDVIAPSFSCAKAAAAVDRAICQTAFVAAADLRLEGAFRAALKRDPAGKAKLLDDQRKWLASRGPLCHFPGNGEIPGDAPGCLVELYNARLALFDAVGAEFDAPFCQAVAKAIEAGGGYLEDRGWSALTTGLTANPDSPVHFVLEGEKIDEKQLARFPGIDPAEAASAYSNELYQFGPDKAFSAVKSTGGTALCKSMDFFIKTGSGFEAVAGPPDLSEGPSCWTSSIFVGEATAAGKARTVPLFAQEDYESKRSALSLWTRKGKAWQAACRIKADYETRIEPAEGFSLAGTPPAALESLALNATRLLDAANPETSPPALASLTLADPAAFQGSVDRDLPLFNHDAKSSYTTFAEATPVYTGEGPSGPLAVRISHGTIGWRTDDGYLAAIYSRNGDVLVPIASFIFDKNRVALKSVTAEPVKDTKAEGEKP